MRNFLRISTEGQSLGRVYSAEEEEQLVVETPVEEVEIQTELQDADRALEVSDALEDLALVAGSIDEASTTDVQMLETAVSVAAGPDVEVSEIVPALESYVGRKLSVEGLVETAKAIWENIKKWLLKIWARVKDFFYKIFGQIPKMRRDIEAMKKRVEAAAGMKKEDGTVSVSTGIKYLSVDGKAVKSINDFNSGLVNWTEVAAAAQDITGAAESYFTEAADVVAAFDVSKADDSKPAVGKLMAKLKSSTDKIGFGASKPSTVDDNYDSKDFTVGYSKSLLGNIVYQNVAPKASEHSLLGSLEQVRRTRINPVSTLGKNKDLDTEVEFTTAGLGELSKALEQAEKIVDAIEKAKRGSAVEKAEKARDKLKAASDKADGQYQKAAKDESVSKESLATFKAMLSLNQSASNFFIAPTTSISQNALSVVRTTLALVAKNLTAYKKA